MVRKIFSLASIILPLCLLLTPFYSFAKTNSDVNIQDQSSDESYFDSITQHMRDDGASESDIKKVIAKIKNGEKLDADKALETGDVSVFFSSQIMTRAKTKSNNDKKSIIESEDDLLSATGEHPSKKITYPDGSYLKLDLDIQKDNDPIDTIKYMKNLSNNTLSSVFSPSYKNVCALLTVHVKGSSIWGFASFTGIVGINTGPDGNEIRQVKDKSIHTILGTFSDDYLKINRKYEIRSQRISAKSYLHYNYTNFMNLSQKTIYLKLHSGAYIGDDWGIWASYTDGDASFDY